MRWKSTTVFCESRNDGRAFLREPGAFLSPNHFHADNDAYNYRSIGSFLRLGANIIRTFEMLEALLRHNTLRPVPAGAPLPAAYAAGALPMQFPATNVKVVSTCSARCWHTGCVFDTSRDSVSRTVLPSIVSSMGWLLPAADLAAIGLCLLCRAGPQTTPEPHWQADSDWDCHHPECCTIQIHSTIITLKALKEFIAIFLFRIRTRKSHRDKGSLAARG